MDKPTANPDNVKQALTQYNLVPEEWGGDVICVPVSALTRKGIDDLLENVLLVAEVKELKANPNCRAKGIIIESRLDKGRGPVATVLVQNGTLHSGEFSIADVDAAVSHVKGRFESTIVDTAVMGRIDPQVVTALFGTESTSKSGSVRSRFLFCVIPILL
jgi:translation initiation factor IF-2